MLNYIQWLGFFRGYGLFYLSLHHRGHLQCCLVGSTDGSVTMTAGNRMAITGSDVLSATSATIVGKEVTVAAAENIVDTVQTSKQQSAGITLGLTGGAVDAAQAIYGAVKRGSEVATSPRPE
ncbi:hypothetical protein ABFU65_11535 [Xanthomonas campestris pv. raphani]|nr:hypothetical protein [Xanthomonas campestris]MEA9653170.1 hypothetical protein [Xanthomonas campestris pv. raphani]MEA9897975.1 hypothetical protein [Xanthomonas campestris pv. raphani]